MDRTGVWKRSVLFDQFFCKPETAVQWLRSRAPTAGGTGSTPGLETKIPEVKQPPRLLCPGDFSGKDTGVGCRVLLQGIFRAQGSNLGLLCPCVGRQILHC